MEIILAILLIRRKTSCSLALKVVVLFQKAISYNLKFIKKNSLLLQLFNANKPTKRFFLFN
jgi:hypothetical protein